MKSFKDLREELSEGLVGNLVKHKSDLKKMQAASAYHDKMQDHHGGLGHDAPDNSDAEDRHFSKSYDHLEAQNHVLNAIAAHKKRNYKERDKHLSLYHKSRGGRSYSIDRYMSGKKDGGVSSIGAKDKK